MAEPISATIHSHALLAAGLLADYFGWTAEEARAQLEAFASECGFAGADDAGKLLTALETRDAMLSAVAAYAAERWLLSSTT